MHTWERLGKGMIRLKKREKEKGHALQRELLQQRLQKDPWAFRVYITLRTIVLLVMVRSVFLQNWENAGICLLALVLFLLPSFVEHQLKIELPTALEVIILLFIFAAEILGEIQAFYIRFPFWDTMLHTINGFLCAAVGFAMVDILNRNPKIKFTLSPLYLAVAAFCFSMTIGVLWEFFEFAADCIVHTDMQKDTVLSTISTVMLDPENSNHAVVLRNITDVTVNGQNLGLGGYLDIGLFDTMKDLLVNFVGAVIFSVIGYFYVKRRGKGKFASHFIPSLAETEEPDES